MPIATPEVYADMLDRAKAGSFAYPAINISSSQTLNAAIRGFAEAGSDGIVQVSTGGAEYLSGPTVKDMVTGSIALAAYAHEVAKNYDVNIALHTDHCPKDKLDGFVRPLLAASAERVKAGGTPVVPVAHVGRLRGAARREPRDRPELLALAKAAHVILEIEVGVVGGEEDGVANEINEQLYTTPEDAVATDPALGAGENGRYLTALTFGNVHGVYKPGNVKLRPEILKTAQEAAASELGLGADAQPFDLVFHGGSGSTAEEIAAAVDYGVVKMNVDTDTQYAFTRPVAGYMLDQLRGRAEGRRRGRQQEAVRPARVGQGGRGRHGRPGRRGLREPALGRHPRYATDNLLGIPETRLPVDPAAAQARGGRRRRDQVAAAYPTSSLAWATLAEDALADGRTVEGYAYARTGYHRGAGLAAQERLARSGPGAVGARAQPRLPAGARRAVPRGAARSARPRRSCAARSSCATPR